MAAVDEQGHALAYLVLGQAAAALLLVDEHGHVADDLGPASHASELGVEHGRVAGGQLEGDRLEARRLLFGAHILVARVGVGLHDQIVFAVEAQVVTLNHRQITGIGEVVLARGDLYRAVRLTGGAQLRVGKALDGGLHDHGTKIVPFARDRDRVVVNDASRGTADLVTAQHVVVDVVVGLPGVGLLGLAEQVGHAGRQVLEGEDVRRLRVEADVDVLSSGAAMPQRDEGVDALLAPEQGARAKGMGLRVPDQEGLALKVAGGDA